MTGQDHEAWNELMARKHNPDAFITKSGACIRWTESRRIKETIRLLECEPHHSVLDLGCGPGNITVRLKGASVVGIDLSDTLLEQARAKVRGRENIKILKGDVECLSLQDSSFDRVLCSEVLEHVREPERVMREIYRVSKPGGRVVITLPNESLINFTKRVILFLGLKKFMAGDYEMSNNMLDEWHVNEIDVSWVRANTRNGFDLTGQKAVPFSFAPYHRLFCLQVKK